MHNPPVSSTTPWLRPRNLIAPGQCLIQGVAFDGLFVPAREAPAPEYFGSYDTAFEKILRDLVENPSFIAQCRKQRPSLGDIRENMSRSQSDIIKPRDPWRNLMLTIYDHFMRDLT